MGEDRENTLGLWNGSLYIYPNKTEKKIKSMIASDLKVFA